jgi:hypothetical protein
MFTNISSLNIAISNFHPGRLSRRAASLDQSDGKNDAMHKYYCNLFDIPRVSLELVRGAGAQMSFRAFLHGERLQCSVNIW